MTIPGTIPRTMYTLVQVVTLDRRQGGLMGIRVQGLGGPQNSPLQFLATPPLKKRGLLLGLLEKGILGL